MPESNIGFYGHVKQYHNLKAEIDQAILDVLESGSYVLGPQLVKFEEELARYMKTKETVGVPAHRAIPASCSSGLQLSATG